MQKKFKKSLFIFRRDLRLHDNTALIEALGCSDEVLPAFIFNPQQLSKNAYRGDNSVQFMLQSLAELDLELREKGSRLYYFYGSPAAVLDELIAEGIEAVFVNRDYTPFSIKRDLKLESLSKKHGLTFSSHSDALLNEVGTVLTGGGTPYTVYSPFAKRSRGIDVKKPRRNSYRNYFSGKASLERKNVFEEVLPASSYNPDLFLGGGREEAKKILRKLKTFSNYNEERDLPALEATTGLSAHNKFGTVSIREVYYSVARDLGLEHTLINELYWRDFFTHVAYHFPRVFGGCFHEKYEAIEWENCRKKFKAWCEGKTGYPIVDAGMRQLNKTGFMHNRVRMIVASFLVKDLHIDWRWGEKYFAQKLIDYDPAVNNGNWQWAASTGCDAQPYFRIFNPWIQGKKFDAECEYIKRWIPELEAYEPKEIHRLEKGGELPGYPRAIVRHSVAKKIAEQMFAEQNR